MTAKNSIFVHILVASTTRIFGGPYHFGRMTKNKNEDLDVNDFNEL